MIVRDHTGLFSMRVTGCGHAPPGEVVAEGGRRDTGEAGDGGDAGEPTGGEFRTHVTERAMTSECSNGSCLGVGGLSDQRHDHRRWRTSPRTGSSAGRGGTAATGGDDGSAPGGFPGPVAEQLHQIRVPLGGGDQRVEGGGLEGDAEVGGGLFQSDPGGDSVQRTKLGVAVPFPIGDGPADVLRGVGQAAGP